MRRTRAFLLVLLCLAPSSLLLGTAGAQGTPTDLRISEAQFNGTFVDGATGRFGVYVQNWGEPTAAESVVRFEIDGEWLGDATLDAGFQGIRLIEAPETWTVTVGPHVFHGTADATEALAESDETNNAILWSFEGQPDVPPPPQREQVFSWRSYAGVANTVETIDVDLEHAYTDVRWGLWCDDSTLQLWLDGKLVAACAQGGASGIALPSELAAGRHRFSMVYLGSPVNGTAGLDATGIPVYAP